MRRFVKRRRETQKDRSNQLRAPPARSQAHRKAQTWSEAVHLSCQRKTLRFPVSGCPLLPCTKSRTQLSSGHTWFWRSLSSPRLSKHCVRRAVSSNSWARRKYWWSISPPNAFTSPNPFWVRPAKTLARTSSSSIDAIRGNEKKTANGAMGSLCAQ